MTGPDLGNFSPVADSFITQTVGLTSVAVGRVISYDNVTGVLKYWQDKSLAGFTTSGAQDPNPEYGLSLVEFISDITTGGNLIISNDQVSTGLTIDSSLPVLLL